MAIELRGTFEIQDCCDCGVRFGVPDGFTANRRKDKRAFTCPNGHSMSYKESEADRLRRERDNLQQQIARVEDEKRTAQAETEKAVAAKKRLEKRINAGVCPCCTRSFTNMARHMKTKHPEFSGAVVPLKSAKAARP